MVNNNRTINLAIVFSLATAAALPSRAQSEFDHTPKWLRASLAARAAQSTNRLIVKFKDQTASGVVRATTLSAAAGTSLRHMRSLGDRVEVIALPQSISNDEARKMAARIETDPSVEYAEPDYKMFPAATPSDPGFSPGINYGTTTNPVLLNQWYLSNPLSGANAPAAWDITTGSSATVIAVVDTGVLQHSDLAGRLATGYDFVSADPNGSFDTANDGNGRDSDASDPGNWVTATEAGTGNFSSCEFETPSDWHGTHVAGIIAANPNNDNIAGLNWAAKIRSVRALGKCGGYTSDIVDGMRWSVGLSVPCNAQDPCADVSASPAKILNLSLGIPSDTTPPSCTRTMQSAINDVIARGATVIAAAGNSKEDAANSLPANCAGVIGVAATLIDGSFASTYSNFGSLITLSAPGGLITKAAGDFGQNGILSINDRGETTPFNDNSTASLFGTSFSSAIVSGVASLMLSVNPNLTPAQIKAILQATARRPFNQTDKGLDCGLTANNTCQQYVVDAAAAVSRASQPILSLLDLNGNPLSLLDFGSGLIDIPSRPQTIIVRNNSAATIRIENLLVAGAHLNDFTASTTCANLGGSGYPFDLGSGLECEIDVTFTAKANNVRTANVVILANVDLPVAVTGSGPTTSTDGGGGSGSAGGGCTIGVTQRFDPTLLLLALASMVTVVRRAARK
jgi:subtilisin family serine protease